MTQGRGIGLDAEGLAGAFPFHFVLGRDDTIVQLGPSLAKAQPNAIGQPIGSVFVAHRPRLALEHATLAGLAPSYVVVRMLSSGLLWRGQTLLSGDHLLFLGTPWLTDAAELSPAGLALADFAPHDSVIDYLTLLQTKNTALKDANNLAAHLRETRKKLQQQLEETRRERHRLEALVGTVPWGVLVESEDGRIALTNQPLCHLFQIPAAPEALVGRPCQELAASLLPLLDDPEGFVREIGAVLDSRQQVLGSEVRMADGRILARDYVPITHDGEFRGHLWQYRDITERHLQRRQLEEARSRAEAANAAKSDFLAMMSHEMRTPLGVVVGIADLLRAEPNAELQREFVRRLDQNARSLLELVDSTLDFAKLENRQVEIDHEPFPPRQLAEAVVETLAPEAQRRGISLLVDIAPEVPRQVLGDEFRLRQILINLIGNALKFTDGNEVLLQMRRAPTTDDTAELQISVRDPGPGIPRDRQTLLFERFVRLEPSRSARGGTGLGLAICRELCEAMKGSIVLDSDLGRSTTFTVRLPMAFLPELAEAARPFAGSRAIVRCSGAWLAATLTNLFADLGAEVAPEATDERGDTASLVRSDGTTTTLVLASPQAPAAGRRLLAPITGARLAAAFGERLDDDDAPVAAPAARAAPRRMPRVLVVDDDQDSVDVCRLILVRAGYSVATAGGVEAALQLLAREPFDLVVSDMRMPDGGGVGLIKQLSERRDGCAWPTPAVVILTAEALEEKRREALRTGACAYLTKPIDSRRLYEAVSQHVDSRPLVVMVEDDESTRMLSALPMRRLPGHRFVACADMATARHVAAHYQVDLALIDVELDTGNSIDDMPGLFEAGVRAAIAYTGHTSPDVHRRCLAKGCAAVWMKPISPSTLQERIQQQLAGPD